MEGDIHSHGDQTTSSDDTLLDQQQKLLSFVPNSVIKFFWQHQAKRMQEEFLLKKQKFNIRASVDQTTDQPNYYERIMRDGVSQQKDVVLLWLDVSGFSILGNFFFDNNHSLPFIHFPF